MVMILFANGKAMEDVDVIRKISGQIVYSK